jgi:hypothetical protein
MNDLVDLFVTNVLKPIDATSRPGSLQQVVDVLMKANIQVSSYLVGDGGDIAWNPPKAGANVPRALRYAITGQTSANAPVDILVVGSIDANSTQTFLQVLSLAILSSIHSFAHSSSSLCLILIGTLMGSQRSFQLLYSNPNKCWN